MSYDEDKLKSDLKDAMLKTGAALGILDDFFNKIPIVGPVLKNEKPAKYTPRFLVLSCIDYFDIPIEKMEDDIDYYHREILTFCRSVATKKEIDFVLGLLNNEDRGKMIQFMLFLVNGLNYRFNIKHLNGLDWVMYKSSDDSIILKLATTKVEKGE